YLAGHAGDLVGKRRQRVGHAVDGLGEGGDLALRFDGDLLREVAGGDGGGHIRDVPHLAGEVAGHEVHRVGEVLPGTGDAFHLRLAAQAAVGAHLARDSRDLVGERRQGVGHAVDGFGEGRHLALGLDGDLLGEVTGCDCGSHLGDVADLVGEVGRHEVDVVGQVFPGAADPLYFGLAAEL